MRKRYFITLICLFIFCGVSIFASRAFSEEAPPSEPLPDELIKELLADNDLPEELKKELEEVLKEGKAEEVVVEPDEILPTEEYPPARREELERLERARDVKPEIKITASSKANRISLDLKGVDIIDVLKMLSARSNLNIVAGRNVRGRVTLFLKDVDTWDAFEIILAANSLAYEKEGNIINVMTERDYEQLYGEKFYRKEKLRIYRLEYAKVADVSKALNQAKSKIGKVIIDEASNTIVLRDSPKAIAEMERMIAEMDMPVETKVFSLNYAKAEDIKAKVTEILTTGVGTIQVDERTNKLVITDLSKKMPEIVNVIEEMDEKHKEVLIEAKIIQIELNDEYRYGIDWKVMFSKPQDKDDETISEYNQADFNFNQLLGSAVNSVISSNTTGAGIALANIASNNVSAALELLQTLGKTNVISSPRITVLNNEEAKVLVGTNQPYVETSQITTEAGADRSDDTVKWIDVGVELTVTPTINNDGFVTMKIKPKISSLGTPLETASGNDVPVVSTSESETTVMVKDGTTIVIAGLIEDRDEFTENKIPFLGDIPIIGNLFKSTNKGSSGTTNRPEKKELVVFLTPYIIHGTETFPEAENVWYGDVITQRELLEQQMSMAVEDLKRKRSLFIEPQAPKEEKDQTTRISDKLGWFTEKEDIEDLQELRAKLKREIKEVKERGTVPDKLVIEKEPEEGEELEKEAMIPSPDFTFPSITGYYSYYEKLRHKIYWFAKDAFPGDYRGEREDVSILFTLTSDGRLKGRPRVINGVDEELAQAAQAAVEKASPFPPFPKKMEREEEVFKITIAYQ